MKVATPAPEPSCPAGTDGPTCSTGPARRLAWTLRELAALVHRPGRRTGDR